MGRDTEDNISKLITNYDDLKFFTKQLLSWYKKNKRDFPWRKKSIDHYKIIISEILLQKTQALTIEEFYPKFIKEFPNWQSIIDVNEYDLVEFLYPVGLSQRKGRLIKEISSIVKINSCKIPSDYDELMAIKGIGDYLASAILVLCFDQKLPLIDINYARLVSRYFAIPISRDLRRAKKIKQIAEVLTNTENIKASDLNFAIIDFSSVICLAKQTVCEKCILCSKCSKYKYI